MNEKDEIDTNTCAICMNNIECTNKESDMKRRLICNHNFHEKCIIKWINNCILNETMARCPCCNDNIFQHEKWFENVKITLITDKLYICVVDTDKPETNNNYFSPILCNGTDLSHEHKILKEKDTKDKYECTIYRKIRYIHNEMEYFYNTRDRFIKLNRMYTPIGSLTPRHIGSGNIIIDMHNLNLYKINIETFIPLKMESIVKIEVEELFDELSKAL